MNYIEQLKKDVADGFKNDRERKNIIETVKFYKTGDGELYERFSDAVQHIGKYICKKCGGRKRIKTGNESTYPLDLPDSDWMHDDPNYQKPIFSKCDLCNGKGYTDKQYKPKMIQEGWEKL